MKRIAIWAVIVGGIGDLVLTNILTLPIALGVFASAGLARLPQDRVGAAYIAALHASPPLYAAALGAGIAAACLGGIIAGLMTKHDRVLNGVLSSWTYLGIDVFSFATHTSTDGLWLQVALTPVAPLAGGLGGYMVRRFKGAERVAPVSFTS